MKRIFSFLIIIFSFLVVELFNGENLSLTPQDVNYNFTTDAVAALNENDNTLKASNSASAVDPTMMILLGSGLVGLAGFGRRRLEK